MSSLINDLKKDVSALDHGNCDEQKVLDAKYFSSYKGKLVVKTNMKRSGALGILFINRMADADTVKHEYGHTKQLDALGLIDYLIFIGFPSWKMLGIGSYYRKPWEISADIYGGVDLRSRKNDDVLTQKHLDDGFKYLKICASSLSVWTKLKKLKPYRLTKR